MQSKYYKNHYRTYGGAIWTNHAIDRLIQRHVPHDLAVQAFTSPDKSLPGKNPGTTEYQKRINNYLVTLVSRKNEHGEYLIVSCWCDPPMTGSIDIQKRDEYQKYKKASLLGRIWNDLKSIVGL
jgi:hypothetical protein